MKNRADWRAKTDPRDADSDDDGIDDSDENAGEVTAYADGVLTIKLLADGTELTGRRHGRDRAPVRLRRREGRREVRRPGRRRRRPRGPRRPWPGEDDEHHGGRHDREHGDDDGHGCDTDALAVGALVEEAELKITADGKVWQEIELR